MFNGTSITLYCPQSTNTSSGVSSSTGLVLSNEFYAMLGLVITTFITSIVSLVVGLCTRQKTSEDKVTWTIESIERADGTKIKNFSLTFSDLDTKKAPIKADKPTDPHSDDASITRQPSSAIVGAEATHVARDSGKQAIDFLDRFCGNGDWRSHVVLSGDGTLPQVQITGGEGHVTEASEHTS